MFISSSSQLCQKTRLEYWCSPQIGKPTLASMDKAPSVANEIWPLGTVFWIPVVEKFWEGEEESRIIPHIKSLMFLGQWGEGKKSSPTNDKRSTQHVCQVKLTHLLPLRCFQGVREWAYLHFTLLRHKAIYSRHASLPGNKLLTSSSRKLSTDQSIRWSWLRLQAHFCQSICNAKCFHSKETQGNTQWEVPGLWFQWDNNTWFIQSQHIICNLCDLHATDF